jgi:prephenate dehydrogenase
MTLADLRLAVFGLGLMGGSLALALRGKCRAILGIDPAADARRLALEMGAVDTALASPDETFEQIDLAVLAAPPRANLVLLEGLPAWRRSPLILIDLSSTKSEICRRMAALPPGFQPVGGHPMCGKEHAGIAHADPALYASAPFALCMLPNTSPAAAALAEDLVASLGAHAIWLEPAVHDRWVAATSHLPYLIANALASATPLEAAPLVGPGFRSTTRLAGSSLAMMLDILATNRPEVLSALGRFRAELEQVASLLEANDLAALRVQLELGAARRRQLL